MDRGKIRKGRASARYVQNRTMRWKPSVWYTTDACNITKIDSRAGINCFLLEVSNGIVHAISLVPDFTHFDSRDSEPVKLFSNRLVTLASCFFQPFPVPDSNFSARVINQSGLMQNSRCQRHRRARRSQHVAKEFVSDRERVRVHAVMAHQQPARQPFCNVMQPIAGRGLSRQYQVRLKIPVKSFL